MKDFLNNMSGVYQVTPDTGDGFRIEYPVRDFIQKLMVSGFFGTLLNQRIDLQESLY